MQSDTSRLYRHRPSGSHEPTVTRTKSMTSPLTIRPLESLGCTPRPPDVECARGLSAFVSCATGRRCISMFSANCRVPFRGVSNRVSGLRHPQEFTAYSHDRGRGSNGGLSGDRVVFEADASDAESPDAALRYSWGRTPSCPADAITAQRVLATTSEEDDRRQSQATFSYETDKLSPECVWVLVQDDKGAVGFASTNVTPENRPPEIRFTKTAFQMSSFSVATLPTDAAPLFSEIGWDASIP